VKQIYSYPNSNFSNHYSYSAYYYANIFNYLLTLK
jgi:hypothetical protein